jgi:hypothetical protein
MVTYNVFSVTTFIEFLKDIKLLKLKPWFTKQRVTVSISYLRGPDQLAFWILPKEYISFVNDQVEYMKRNQFNKTEINQLERLLPLFDSVDENTRIELQKRFKLFADEHDFRRGTKLIESIPSLEKLYKSCT